MLFALGLVLVGINVLSAAWDIRNQRTLVERNSDGSLELVSLFKAKRAGAAARTPVTRASTPPSPSGPARPAEPARVRVVIAANEKDLECRMFLAPCDERITERCHAARTGVQYEPWSPPLQMVLPSARATHMNSPPSFMP